MPTYTPWVGIGHTTAPRTGGGPGIPEVGFVIVMPEWLRSSARLERLHAQASKEAARVVMMTHWRKRIPGHFTTQARSKYQHKERLRSTKAKKRKFYGSRTDLVKTSRTRLKMTQQVPTVRVGGKASNILRVSMQLPFGFPATFDRARPGSVSVEQMSLEISRWTDAEMSEAAAQYRDAYVTAFEQLTANSPEIRQRIGMSLAAIRSY
jgi:hypothetical protein